MLFCSFPAVHLKCETGDTRAFAICGWTVACISSIEKRQWFTRPTISKGYSRYTCKVWKHQRLLNLSSMNICNVLALFYFVVFRFRCVSVSFPFRFCSHTVATTTERKRICHRKIVQWRRNVNFLLTRTVYRMIMPIGTPLFQLRARFSPTFIIAV